MKKILILGSTGMLGSMVLGYLSTKEDLEITAPTREQIDETSFKDFDYIINCIGVIKQKLTDVEDAIYTNSLLPYAISKNRSPETKIIQIATDCVFSGKKGGYLETDEHDASDVYGKTKSLGEVNAEGFFNIRTSVIGPSKRDQVSLFEWFMSQEKGAIVRGYANHFWNGVTTLHFAKMCYAIIKRNIDLPNVIHFIPADTISKLHLLEVFSKKFDRADIQIESFFADPAIDRSLLTNEKYKNLILWNAMGYENPPTIEEMVEELANYMK